MTTPTATTSGSRLCDDDHTLNLCLGGPLGLVSSARMVQMRYGLMILFLSLGVASSNCLQGAIPLERRSNLTNAATSSNYALGIFVNKWAAGYLTSAVVQIIIQEVLGLHARVSGKGGSTVDAFYALAGCEHPTATGDDRGCDVNLVTSHHINVEGWTESYQPTWDRVQQGYAPVAPINLGNMGYFGKTSMYLSSKVVQTAWEAEGLNLEFYRGYNVSWHNAAKYFLPPASMNVSRLKRCNETRLMESEAMEIYLNLTGDTDGIEITEDGKVTGRCWNGYFWYPPSCRLQQILLGNGGLLADWLDGQKLLQEVGSIAARAKARVEAASVEEALRLPEVWL